MKARRFHVVEGEELFLFLLDAANAARTYRYPPKVSSPTRKAAIFAAENKEFYDVPRSLLRGTVDHCMARTDDMSGFSLSGDTLSVRLLGDIVLDGDTSDLIGPRFIQLWGGAYRDPSLTIQARTTRRCAAPSARSIRRDHEGTNLTELRKEDYILDFVITSEKGFRGEHTWRMRDILEHIHQNPSLTRKEIEKLGIRGDRDWDLVVNFQDGLRQIIKVRDKPKDLPIFLSDIQYEKRQKREKRLPEVIETGDVDSGNLEGQAFDGEIFRAMQKNQLNSFFL